MEVPFVDLTEPTQQIKTEYLAAVEKLLDRGRFVLSEEVTRFETEWATTIGAKHCVGVSNCADALYLALTAAGVGPDDEVITQGNAYNASVTAIQRVGAAPRFADIHPTQLTIDTDKIEALITDKTKAILPVHLFGQPNEMDKIIEITQNHHLAVIEDCAQAHLAEYQGRKVGTWGDYGAFSFYPTKNLGAFGDAGALVTNNTEKAAEIAARGNLGQTAKNNHQYFGTNMRLDPLQAIALSLKLPHLAELTAKRQAAGEYYDQLLATAGLPVQPVARVAGATHVYHLYVIQLMGHDRTMVQQKLAEAGIQTAIHYPIPVYRQPFYKGSADQCPVTEQVANRILSLPLFPAITKAQQEHVVESLRNIIS